MIMILKQDSYISYININVELFFFGNWKAMRLETAYKWWYTFICTRQDCWSNSAARWLCVPVSCQCCNTSTIIIHCQCLPSTYLHLSLRQALCHSHIRQLCTIHHPLCPRHLPPFHPLCHCSSCGYQHISQFSEFHSQQQKKSIKKFPPWDSNPWPTLDHPFGSPMDYSLS